MRLAMGASDEKRSVADVRVRVFHDEQGFSLDDEMDSWDACAAHFMLYSTDDPSKAVGTMRWVTLPAPGDCTPVPSIRTDAPLGPSVTEEALSAQFREAFASAKEGEAAGGKLGRLAVDVPYRKGGVGKFLVEAAERWLYSTLSPGNEGKVCTIKLGAQMPVQRFYQKLGYTAVGEPFDDSGQPHIMMVKTFIL